MRGPERDYPPAQFGLSWKGRPLSRNKATHRVRHDNDSRSSPADVDMSKPLSHGFSETFRCWRDAEAKVVRKRNDLGVEIDTAWIALIGNCIGESIFNGCPKRRVSPDVFPGKHVEVFEQAARRKNPLNRQLIRVSKVANQAGVSAPPNWVVSVPKFTSTDTGDDDHQIVKVHANPSTSQLFTAVVETSNPTRAISIFYRSA
jgi:hypothetical protein